MFSKTSQLRAQPEKLQLLAVHLCASYFVSMGLNCLSNGVNNSLSIKGFWYED